MKKVGTILIVASLLTITIAAFELCFEKVAVVTELSQNSIVVVCQLVNATYIATETGEVIAFLPVEKSQPTMKGFVRQVFHPPLATQNTV